MATEPELVRGSERSQNDISRRRIGARLQRDATQRNLSAAMGNRQGAPFINLKGIAIGDGAMDPPSQFANFSSLLWYLGTHARTHAP